MSDKFTFAYPAPRQVGGDDGYQYVVFVRGSVRLSGLTRSEATYYRQKFENEERAARKLPNYQDPGPSKGTVLRERGFDLTTYDRKTKRYSVACSKCATQIRKGKVAHTKDCKSIPLFLRKRGIRRWTVLETNA